MTLSNLCSLADTYYIAEHKPELNQTYISSSEFIYSDGTFKHHINNDGYIEIGEIVDANYVTFIDQAGNLYLAIYKYIQEIKFKEIIDRINKIRDQTGMHKHSTVIVDNDSDAEPPAEKDKILTNSADGDLVNVNNMVCSICGSNKFVEPFVYDADHNITCECENCRTVYYLIPSKYYIIKSKTIFTASTNNAVTRKIKMEEEQQ